MEQTPLLHYFIIATIYFCFKEERRKIAYVSLFGAETSIATIFIDSKRGKILKIA